MDDEYKPHKKKKPLKRKVITIQKSHKNDQVIPGEIFHEYHPEFHGKEDDFLDGSPYRAPNDLRHWLGEDFIYI